jgi:hypothetical protein
MTENEFNRFETMIVRAVGSAVASAVPKAVDEAVARAIPDAVNVAVARAVPKAVDAALVVAVPREVAKAVPLAVDAAMVKSLPREVDRTVPVAVDAAVKRSLGVYSEDAQHKFEILAEGQQMLSEQMQRMGGELRDEIRMVDQRVTHVAADLSAHRADTEAHRGVYGVRED